jgi:hypothetical protein
MTAAAWNELGIEPTDDARAIRRAYALRLKQTRPESDPEGFSRLRHAFEAALRSAEGAAGRPIRPEVLRPREAISISPTAFPEAAEARIAELADAGKTLDAVAALADAIDRSTLPLALEMKLKDRLLLSVIHDRRLGGVALSDAARRLGWLEADGRGTGQGQLLRDLTARIAAETWYERLVATSQSKRYRLGDEPAAAARLLIGAGDPIARFLPPSAELKLQLSAYHFHRRWIEHRFKLDTIAAAERLTERPYPGRLHGLLWRFVVYGAIVSTMAATAVLFAPAIFGLPYCRIRTFSRPGLAASGAIMAACLLLSAVMPTGVIYLIRTGAHELPDNAVYVYWGICLVTVVGLKQLFLPGKRQR